MAARILLAVLSLGAALVAAEDLEWCGDARYYPSEYTCFDDSFMCPVLFGLPNLPCNGGCYADQMYQCDDGSLKLRGEQKKPFVLKTASSSEHVDGLVVNACGGYLAIGTGARECPQCKDSDDVDCEEYGNKLVLLPDGEMAVDVPGGQQWYINPSDGTLSYTREVDTEALADGLSGSGVTSQFIFLRQRSRYDSWFDTNTMVCLVFEDGFFSPPGRPYWLACLRTLPGGTPGTTRSYRLYAPTAENLEKTGCDQVKLIATSVDRKQGAYEWM
ncbi:hypothetical protein jhhlp_000674 [Lomentospora prolificans]|uniref:Endo-1,3(4)-beta-glucanase 1 carbohydrate binding domain-containing protein n=1 Tax=Lomentospora prolificans TaxID=41688 RepID=A0A2N3NJ72_9PEZI|nr:hypothetical protein jhhlp_000674 [Lomentospora prolificans]